MKTKQLYKKPTLRMIDMADTNLMNEDSGGQIIDGFAKGNKSTIDNIEDEVFGQLSSWYDAAQSKIKSWQDD